MNRGPTKRNRAAADDLNSAAIHLLRGLRPVDERAGLTAARLSALSWLSSATRMRRPVEAGTCSSGAGAV